VLKADPAAVAHDEIEIASSHVLEGILRLAYILIGVVSVGLLGNVIIQRPAIGITDLGAGSFIGGIIIMVIFVWFYPEPPKITVCPGTYVPCVQDPGPFQRIRAQAAGHGQVGHEAFGVSGVRIIRSGGGNAAVVFACGAQGIVIAHTGAGQERKKERDQIRQSGPSKIAVHGESLRG
jgi:hypothetical protein